MADLREREKESREAAYRERLRSRINQADQELRILPRIKHLRAGELTGEEFMSVVVHGEGTP